MKRLLECDGSLISFLKPNFVGIYSAASLSHKFANKRITEENYHFSKYIQLLPQKYDKVSFEANM